MSLENIIGHEKAVERLLGIISNRRVASSYLFCGEQGIGKKTTAIEFAKALNCLKSEVRMQNAEVESKKPEGSLLKPQTSALKPGASHLASFDACDECESCRKMVSGTHPDFRLVSPQERQIRIDEIRGIEETLAYKSVEGRYKVVVVDNAETMNSSAANAFLKTLEEPPGDSIIILVSSNPETLPATIRSRCSRVNFTPLSPEACRKILEGKIPEDNIDVLCRLSMGRPGVALSADFVGEETWFFGLFRGMLHSEKDGWSSREDMEKWFDYMLILLRDLAVVKISGDPAGLLLSDTGKQLKSLSKSLDVKVIIHIFEEITALKKYLLFNLNKSITWNYTASLLRKELLTESA
jgi:DNA polymerase-3 subunit delta'